MNKSNKNIYIALGGNLSNPRASFLRAISLMAEQGCEIRRQSGLWQSPSWPPGQGAPDYLNAVISIGYERPASDLLQTLQAIEAQCGRERSYRNAPRTLDLDILDFAGQVSRDETLLLPHPRMYVRSFVLFPLQQIAPDWTDPVSGQTLSHLIARLPLSDVAPLSYIGPMPSKPLE